jgi:molybdopterin synthase sulfur carrier subunit
MPGDGGTIRLLMRLQVLLFASLREKAGSMLEVEVPGVTETTVAEIRALLERASPDIALMGRRAAMAVNENWSRETDPVREGDVLALIPPVAGG